MTEVAKPYEKADKGRKQADILIAVASSAELFHTPDGTGYADVMVNGHCETYAIRSKFFRQWLTRGFFNETEGAPNAEAMQSAVALLEARAKFNGNRRSVFVRIAEHDGRIYIDLANDDWQVIEVTASGWKIRSDAPVRFRRPVGMRPLPLPVRGGKIDELKRFINVADETDFVLIIAWLLAAMRTSGPFPVCVVSGEQGSAKSTCCAILRRLIDPNLAPLRALPREERDLFIAANNSHVIAFDNLSGLAPWLSDTMCRLATGGGFAIRQLFSDGDEVLFDAQRPIIANGIEDFITRPDLADRSLFLTLMAISEGDRKSEQDIWAAFDREHPKLFGALLDGVVRGLQNRSSTICDGLPRMADFALWAMACETAFWPAGTFMRAYNANREGAVSTVLEADAVAVAIRDLMSERAEWSGTATDLLSTITGRAEDATRKDRSWPTSARQLSGRVRRSATFLRKLGIVIETGDREGHQRARIIMISNSLEKACKSSVGPSAPSASPEKRPFRADDSSAADGRLHPHAQPPPPIVRSKLLKTLHKTDADDADCTMQPFSRGEHIDASDELGEVF